MRGDTPVLARPTKPPIQHTKSTALRFGLDQHGRVGVWAVCGACGHTEGVILHRNAPPVAIDQRFAEQRGWLIEHHGVRATCPPCQEKSVTATTPTINKAKAERIMHGLLTEHLNVKGDVGEYNAGWSDARVAEESQLSERHVADMRREGYAAKLRDTMSESLRVELQAIAERIEQEYKDLRTLIDQWREEARRHVNGLKDKLRATGRSV